jgi:protein-S-isoprenylcysteine O-methyltransferase Ste14
MASFHGEAATPAQPLVDRTGGIGMKLKALVGSGDRIGLFALPFFVVGIVLNVLFPSLFAVGGPSVTLNAVSVVFVIPGIVIWAWSVVLILTKVPKGRLITSGPYSVVKHPLYVGMALLVLPWGGFLLNTWLGLPLGAVLYMGSRLFSPKEETELAGKFGTAWGEYCKKVKIPSL